MTTFEAERVVEKLRTNYPVDAANVVAIEASYLYLLLLRADAEATVDHQRLAELLGDGRRAYLPASAYGLGRGLGTQSPWSSKATDILHNTGFTAIERIERARVVRIVSSGEGMSAISRRWRPRCMTA
jgi:phosphoribosylformylglycinamidine synthase